MMMRFIYILGVQFMVGRGSLLNMHYGMVHELTYGERSGGFGRISTGTVGYRGQRWNRPEKVFLFFCFGSCWKPYFAPESGLGPGRGSLDPLF